MIHDMMADIPQNKENLKIKNIFDSKENCENGKKGCC